MNNKQQTLEEKLKALRDSYAQQLPAKLHQVNELWSSLNNGDWDWSLAKDFHRHVHTLSGSAPTFGFHDVGQNARQIELVSKSWIANNKQPSQDERDTVRSMLAALTSTKDLASGPSEPTKKSVPDWVNEKTDMHLIYLIDSNRDFAADLSAQLSQFDYRVKIFSSAENIDDAMKKARPSAIIVNVTLSEVDLAGVILIRGIKAQYSANLPVIFISTHNDFESRLQAVRAGGDAYYIKPLEIGPLVDRLDQLTNSHTAEPFRILVVDDDQSLAMHYSLVLENAGMDVTIVNDPRNVISALAEVRPELILMDVYMPLCSGLELAKLIRQQDAYVGIPIVFLSSETSLDKQFQAMRMGGDDFLTKPISDHSLIASITIRADRSRTLNTLMVQDSLTGLLEHTKIKEQLAIEVSRAIRAETPVSFAMIDIDYFKKVNDNYGHLTGDLVIKSLARLLQQRLRLGDSIGRYGGEEFAAVLPGCTMKQAESIFDEIRIAFSKLHFLHNEQEIRVTVSVGIADTSQHTKAEEINLAADEALYAAKEGGRNCVRLALSKTQ